MSTVRISDMDYETVRRWHEAMPATREAFKDSTIEVKINGLIVDFGPLSRFAFVDGGIEISIDKRPRPTLKLDGLRKARVDALQEAMIAIEKALPLVGDERERARALNAIRDLAPGCLEERP